MNVSCDCYYVTAHMKAMSSDLFVECENAIKYKQILIYIVVTISSCQIGGCDVARTSGRVNTEEREVILCLICCCSCGKRQH